MSFMLAVTIKSFMLNVVMLNVIMLNVVALINGKLLDGCAVGHTKVFPPSLTNNRNKLERFSLMLQSLG
jgi:hypothetical protein